MSFCTMQVALSDGRIVNGYTQLPPAIYCKEVLLPTGQKVFIPRSIFNNSTQSSSLQNEPSMSSGRRSSLRQTQIGDELDDFMDGMKSKMELEERAIKQSKAIEQFNKIRRDLQQFVLEEKKIPHSEKSQAYLKDLENKISLSKEIPICDLVIDDWTKSFTNHLKNCREIFPTQSTSSSQQELKIFGASSEPSSRMPYIAACKGMQKLEKVRSDLEKFVLEEKKIPHSEKSQAYLREIETKIYESGKKIMSDQMVDDWTKVFTSYLDDCRKRFPTQSTSSSSIKASSQDDLGQMASKLYKIVFKEIDQPHSDETLAYLRALEDSLRVYSKDPERKSTNASHWKEEFSIHLKFCKDQFEILPAEIIELSKSMDIILKLLEGIDPKKFEDDVSKYIKAMKEILKEKAAYLPSSVEEVKKFQKELNSHIIFCKGLSTTSPPQSHECKHTECDQVLLKLAPVIKALDERNAIRKDTNLNIYYTRVKNRLESVFVAYKTANEGLFGMEGGKFATVGKVAETLLSFLPGGGLIGTLVGGGINMVDQAMIKREVEYIVNIANQFQGDEIDSIARQLTLSYKSYFPIMIDPIRLQRATQGILAKIQFTQPKDPWGYLADLTVAYVVQALKERKIDSTKNLYTQLLNCAITRLNLLAS